MPKSPFFIWFAALAIIACFSAVASAEDRSPSDLSADVTAKTPDITVHNPVGVPATVTQSSTSYTEQHTDLPNGASTIIQKQERHFGAANPVPSVSTDVDMTVDDEE